MGSNQRANVIMAYDHSCAPAPGSKRLMMVSTVTKAPCGEVSRLATPRAICPFPTYRLQETNVEERNLDQLGRGGGGQERENGGGASKEHGGKNIKEEVGRAWERIEGVKTVCC